LQLDFYYYSLLKKLKKEKSTHTLLQTTTLLSMSLQTTICVNVFLNYQQNVNNSLKDKITFHKIKKLFKLLTSTNDPTAHATVLEEPSFIQTEVSFQTELLSSFMSFDSLIWFDTPLSVRLQLNDLLS
jgi:hypothetical protein